MAGEWCTDVLGWDLHAHGPKEPLMRPLGCVVSSLDTSEYKSVHRFDPRRGQWVVTETPAHRLVIKASSMHRAWGCHSPQELLELIVLLGVQPGHYRWLVTGHPTTESSDMCMSTGIFALALLAGYLWAMVLSVSGTLLNRYWPSAPRTKAVERSFAYIMARIQTRCFVSRRLSMRKCGC